MPLSQERRYLLLPNPPQGTQLQFLQVDIQLAVQTRQTIR